MADVTGASLAPIYSRLNSAPNYHPLEADTFADWSLEAGDMVTVTRDNNSYESPVHSSTVTWKKGAQVSISSTGNESREAISKVSNKKYTSGSGSLRSTENAYYAIETSYNDMKSGLILASSSASLYVEQAYGMMKAGLDLTSSSAALYVDNKYTAMSTGLKLTSSSAALYVDSKYNAMSTGLKLTSSSAALYVDSKYNAMSTGLKLTSSSAALYVDSKYNAMSTGLALTSSSAALYVNSKYNAMSTGLALTSSSAALYASSATNAAQIVARINDSSGQSEIEINADKIYQLGQTIANTITADYINTKVETLATLNAKNISCNSITAGTNIYGPNGLSLYTNGLWNVTLSGPTNNVYTLKQTTLNGTETTIGTFSRATTLTRTWSSGTVTVTASPQGNTLTMGIFDVASNDVTWNGNVGTFNVYTSLNDAEVKYNTGKTLTVTCPVTASDLGIYDVNSNLVASQTLNRGSSIDLWSGYWNGTKWVWGSKVTISAQGDPSYNYSMTVQSCTSYGGGLYKITCDWIYSSSFSVGSSIGFWRK